MSQDQLRALLEHGEEQGCLNLSLFNEVVGLNENMAKEIGRVSKIIGEEGNLTERAALHAGEREERGEPRRQVGDPHQQEDQEVAGPEPGPFAPWGLSSSVKLPWRISAVGTRVVSTPFGRVWRQPW